MTRLLAVLLCVVVLAASATPSAAPETELDGAADAAQGQRGAPQYVSGPANHPADRLAVRRLSVPRGGAPPTYSAADVTYSGIINYASPSHGRYYLAIPDGRGIRVEICGPAGCLIRTSTDAGPDLAMQRAGRIADLNSVDWQRISGVPLRFGGFQGTILILRRPARIELPQTNMEGPK